MKSTHQILYTVLVFSTFVVFVQSADGYYVSRSADGRVIVTPDASQNLTWWQKAVFYQIYPRSFKDSDVDGVGDIRGIISKLDYLVDLGIDCVWLSPVCRSPMKDFGYDCSDAGDIDPIFGDLDDFKDLVQAVHDKGLKLIVDFVPGYTSDQHVWFQKSVRREGKYTDFYVWDDGRLLDNGTRTPPNNWLSIFGGSAWQWNDQRQQFYYHVFIKEAPELNHRNLYVEWELKSLLRFWLDLGVDGFRADAIPNILTVANHSWNEPLSGKDVPPFQEDYLDHIYTQHQPEMAPILKGWYDLLAEYTSKDGLDSMVLETYASHETRNSLYAQGAGNPFNFDLLQMSRPPTSREIFQTVMAEYGNLTQGKWPNFVLGNHDNTRVSARNGARYVDVYNMLVLTLWGTPTTYYGEELGMLQANITWEETVDPWGLNFGPDRYMFFSRDPERTPMQWTNDTTAGFTTGNSTWLPLAENYTLLNVQTESDSSRQSSLQLYKQLTTLRKNPVFLQGVFEEAIVDSNIVSYSRHLGAEKFLVVLNFGQQTTVDMTSFGGLMARTVVTSPGIKHRLYTL
ncbi:maltase 1-like [Physella acuta]|uniref:maltase 1-like n=1 Tax=Physella acuta TaxID=109671 RepID=UPI0027DDF1AE|nr:maltase 1-like [Physella acuta]